MVVVSQVLTIDKSELVDKIGTLSKVRVDEVLKGIKLLTESRDTDEEIEQKFMLYLSRSMRLLICLTLFLL